MFCYQCPPALHPCGPHPPRLPTLDYPFAATHPCEYEYEKCTCTQMYLTIYQMLGQKQIARCSMLSAQCSVEPGQHPIGFRLKANDNRPTTDYILLLYLVVTLTNYSISGTKWMKNVQPGRGQPLGNWARALRIGIGIGTATGTCRISNYTESHMSRVCIGFSRAWIMRRTFLCWIGQRVSVCMCVCMCV